MKEIPLKKGLAAWIDDADFERFGSLKWRLHSTGFAVRDGEKVTGKKGIILLHRVIAGATAVQRVSPINWIKLDCRRENLRVEEESKPGRNADEEDLSALVIRFVQAFPAQTKFGLPCLRRQLRTLKAETGMETEQLLRRIEAWSKARANIAPEDLAKPAPILTPGWTTTETPVPARTMPEASEAMKRRVRAIQTPWQSDGTV